LLLLLLFSLSAVVIWLVTLCRYIYFVFHTCVSFILSSFKHELIFCFDK
jgi:hypothetical protein